MGVRRSPKEASRDAGKSEDFEVASETTQERRATYLLELERSNGVCELMIDLRRRSMEDGTAEAMRAGNVEGLQKERTWNLSQVM